MNPAEPKVGVVGVGLKPKFNTMDDLMAHIDSQTKADANKETNLGRSKGAKKFRARRKAEKRAKACRKRNGL